MNSSRDVDIHCHLLPDWDDGPRSLNEALEMARRAANHGVSDIFVTPHVGRDLSAIGVRQTGAAHEIPSAVTALQSAVHEAGLELNLWPGAELVIASDLPARLEREPNLTLGSGNRYALVELAPGAPWTGGVDEILFQIALRGVTPIMAHPERYPDVQRDLSRVQQAAARGILFQLTAASLQSKGIVRDTSYRLLENGLVSFVASDAHTPHDVWPQQIQEILISLLGRDGCQRIRQNALALVPAAAHSSAQEITAKQFVVPAHSSPIQASAKEEALEQRPRSFWARFGTRRER